MLLPGMRTLVAAMVEGQNRQTLFPKTAQVARQLCLVDNVWVFLLSQDGDRLVLVSDAFDAARMQTSPFSLLIRDHINHPLTQTLYSGEILQIKDASFYSEIDFAPLLGEGLTFGQNVRSLAVFPVKDEDASVVGELVLVNPHEDVEHLGAIIAHLLGLCLSRFRLLDDIARGDAPEYFSIGLPARKQVSILNSPTMIGDSQAIMSLQEKLSVVADSDISVLLQGETGVGKEIAAQTIHALSSRRGSPFVSVNCSAIPEHLLESELFGHVKGAFSGATQNRKGLFSSAEGGTLLLDEIGDMPLAMQSKLLRALQERKCRPVGSDEEVSFDVRIIAATHQELEEKIKARLFRKDLYYRLNAFPVVLPPLRHRKEDIRLLALHFAQEAMQEQNKKVNGFTPEAMRLLEQHDYPGNIREMKNLIVYAVLNCPAQGRISTEHFPEKGGGTTIDPQDMSNKTLEEAVALFERSVILDRVRQHCGKREMTAQSLNISRRTLFEKMRRYEIA